MKTQSSAMWLSECTCPLAASHVPSDRHKDWGGSKTHINNKIIMKHKQHRGQSGNRASS